MDESILLILSWKGKFSVIHFLLVNDLFYIKVNLLWHENSSCDMKVFSVTGNFIFICRKHIPVKFLTKTREFLPTFRGSMKISWEPGSLAPGEYPTLGRLHTIKRLGSLETVKKLFVYCWIKHLSTQEFGQKFDRKEFSAKEN